MKNHLKTFLLLGTLTALLVGIGGVLGGAWTWIALAMAVLLNVGAYFFSDSLVLKMSGAVEVSPTEAPRLHAMVEELAQRAGIPKPRVYRIADPHANAFATGRNPEKGVVAVTDGIVSILSERELRGVIAHEIAHIKNRDILVSTIATVVAAAIGHIASMLQWSAILGGGSSDDEEEGGSMAGALVVAFTAPMIAMLVQFAVSRTREYLADETGARIAEDPEALAQALLKLERAAHVMPGDVRPATASLYIVNPLTAGQRLARWFSTHPATEDRVARLRKLRA